MITPKYVWSGVFAILIIAITTACSKDKFNTIPQIKIYKINPQTGIIKRNSTGAGNELSIEIEYTDKQGDLNDTLWLRKIRRNRRVAPATPITTGFRVQIPDFPNTPKGIIKYTFDFSSELAPANNLENDTVYFRFMVKDKANNKSDTIQTRDIIIGN